MCPRLVQSARLQNAGRLHDDATADETERGKMQGHHLDHGLGTQTRRMCVGLAGSRLESTRLEARTGARRCRISEFCSVGYGISHSEPVGGYWSPSSRAALPKWGGMGAAGLYRDQRNARQETALGALGGISKEPLRYLHHRLRSSSSTQWFPQPRQALPQIGQSPITFWETMTTT